MGGEWCLGVALVMEAWPRDKRPLLAGIIGAAANVGFALIAVLGLYWKVSQDSWRWVMLAGAAPAALTFFIQLFVPESESWKESVKSGAAQTIQEIFSSTLLRNTLLPIPYSPVAFFAPSSSVPWPPPSAAHLSPR